MPKLYDELADWWPLMSAPDDYEEEAAFYAAALAAACARPPRTVLELGSGGGNNASHLKVAIRDGPGGTVSRHADGQPRAEPRMRARSGRHAERAARTSVRRRLRPRRGVLHDVRVGSAAGDRDRLRALRARRRGGVRAGRDPRNVPAGHRPRWPRRRTRGLRYLSWTWDPDPSDTSYLTDYAYLLRMPDGTMRVEHDRHVEGLFARADWLRLLSAAGFEPRSVRFDHSELEPGSYEIFVARGAARPHRPAV